MEGARARVDWIGEKDMAEALLKSIQPDDPDSFRSEITEVDIGVRLSIFVSSSDLGQMRATIDDILACLSAVEGSLGALED
tara:strand:+ start:12591 stop:12833 length:243 start_codon:yes stop_codon:yes gene_type:complete